MRYGSSFSIDWLKFAESMWHSMSQNALFVVGFGGKQTWALEASIQFALYWDNFKQLIL